MKSTPVPTLGARPSYQGGLEAKDSGAMLYHYPGLAGSIVDYLFISTGVDSVQRLKPCPHVLIGRGFARLSRGPAVGQQTESLSARRFVTKRKVVENHRRCRFEERLAVAPNLMKSWLDNDPRLVG